MYILNMDHNILLPLILMIESSFQDSDGNQNCNYNKVSHGTLEEFCCPKCTQDKEKCRYDCPIGYYRFGKRCSGILQTNIEHSKPFSPFVCYQKCPKTHYGITLNETKVCVSCSILCLDTFIETSCSCASFERETDIKLYLNWIITNAITGSILLVAATYILISCCFRKWNADKRRNKAKIYKCGEKDYIPKSEDQTIEMYDKITMDIEHEAENHIAVAAMRQHEKKTRYVVDPTGSPKKLKKEEHVRVRSSAYANTPAIRLNEILNPKRISRAFSQLFGLKHEIDNPTFEEDSTVEQSTTSTTSTSTQTLSGDELHCYPNKASTDKVGQPAEVVVDVVHENVLDNGHDFPTVQKTKTNNQTLLKDGKTLHIGYDQVDASFKDRKKESNTQIDINPLHMKDIANETRSTSKLLHDIRNDKNISESSLQTMKENTHKDVTVDPFKQVTFAAETIPKTKSEVNNDQQGLTMVDETINEPYENVSFERKDTTNFPENNFEVHTDPINFLRRNKKIVHKFDRDSKASINSNKSTSSSNSKSAESDVSNASYKTAPSESPRLSEVDDQHDYSKDILKAASSSDQIEEETGYENIPYLSEMKTDLIKHSNIDSTKRNELINGPTIDTNSNSIEELTSISDNAKDNQLVTSENRVSSGSDLSFHSIHNQCVGLESQDAVVKNNEQHNTNTTCTAESIDMKTITSQTNMSFNNSTINLVINQSN